MQLKCDVK